MTDLILTDERMATLCHGWDITGKDPVDQLRRQQRQDQFILGYILRGGDRHDLSKAAQADLVRLLRFQGLAVETTPHKDKIDLVITDPTGHVIKAELKAASWTLRALQPKYGRYKADIRRHQLEAADLVIFGCWVGGPATRSCWYWFVIPAAAVSSRSLEITRKDPANYAGKYRRYLGAWDVLWQALSRAHQPCPRQLPMEVSP